MGIDLEGSTSMDFGGQEGHQVQENRGTQHHRHLSRRLPKCLGVFSQRRLEWRYSNKMSVAVVGVQWDF